MCGIAAYIGDQFDPLMFKILALQQDSRGGLGCGVFFQQSNGDVIKIRSVVEKVNKSSFFPKVEDTILNEYNHNSLYQLYANNDILKYSGVIVGAHSRKPTVGKVALEFTHPISYGHITMLHNGTITNYNELKNAYYPNDENINGDSSLMAAIVDSGNYKMLLEYIGAATLVWIDERNKNHLYVFVGKSNLTTAERGLYYMKSEEGIYFSSESTPLESIYDIKIAPGVKMSLPEAVPTNKVLCFSVDGTMSVVKEVNRIKTTSNVQTNTLVSSKYVKDSLDDEYNTIQYYNGRYYYNGSKISTEYNLVVSRDPNTNTYVEITKNVYIDVYGNMRQAKDYMKCKNNTIRPFYFFEGILFLNKAAFEDFIIKHSLNWVPTTLIGYVVNPIPINVKIKDAHLLAHYHPSVMDEKLNGSYTPIFTKKVYSYQNGNLISILPTKLSSKAAKVAWDTVLDRMDKSVNVQEEKSTPLSLEQYLHVLEGNVKRRLDKHKDDDNNEFVKDNIWKLETIMSILGSK